MSLFKCRSDGQHRFTGCAVCHRNNVNCKWARDINERRHMHHPLTSRAVNAVLAASGRSSSASARCSSSVAACTAAETGRLPCRGARTGGSVSVIVAGSLRDRCGIVAPTYLAGLQFPLPHLLKIVSVYLAFAKLFSHQGELVVVSFELSGV